MKKIAPVTGDTGVLPGALREMLSLAAQSLGLSLEIWSRAERTPERLSLAASCSTCELKEPRMFDRCRKRRSYLTRREAQVSQELTENCPMKLRLARLGPDSPATAPVLFAFGYAPPSNDEQHDRRVMSFLRDLQGLLREHRDSMASDVGMTNDRASSQEQINLLYSVSGRFATHHDLSQTTAQVLNEWRTVLDAECGFLWLRDRDLLELSFAPGAPDARSAEARRGWKVLARRLSDGFERSGEPAILEHLDAEHPIARTFDGPMDCVAVPLVVEGATRGVLCGLHRGFRDCFGATEVRLLKSLGSQLALTVAHAQLYEDLQGFITSTVKTLTAAIDAKDSLSCGHSQRVNIVSMLLGHEMDLDLEDLEALYWGALLHDVGKIGMPDDTLEKPSALDENDAAIVREHPERGWELLHPIQQLRRAAEGVRHHHERWDGQGYPMALSEMEIPVIARLIAVADTFDAIISKRSSGKGQSVLEAVERIEESAGRRFDPEVTAALRRLHPLLERHQWVLMSGRKLALGS